MEISYAYVKKRRDFGKHAAFTAQDADVLFDLRPNEEFAQEHIERAVNSAAVQASHDVSEHEVNTFRAEYTTSGMSHTEGGWPKEVDVTEAESVTRYRKKIEKDEQYVQTVVKLAGVMEDMVKCNNAIDIYEEYFPEGPPEPAASGPPEANTIALLKDPCPGFGRSAHYVSWHPDGGRRLAVAYCIMEFQQQPEGMPLTSAVWNLSNTLAPESLLQPISQLTCINHNQRDSNLLGAGQYNGQFAVFDTRKGSSPADISPIQYSHRDPIFDFAWQQTKTGMEAMTVSTDGNVFWWDIRRLVDPIEKLVLAHKDPEHRPVGGVSIEYSTAAGPNKFAIGTEGGMIYSCNRRGKTPEDRIGTIYQGHHGTVCGVMRHPMFAKYLLSVGDWAVRVWNEELKTPIIGSKYHDCFLTSARWSPTRPGVFFTTKVDGNLDVWDYYEKQHEPVLSQQMSGKALQTVRLRQNGAEMAVGAHDGCVSIVRLSPSLVEAQPNERATIQAMLERETNKEKALEKIAKDNKIKARRAEADAAKMAAANDEAAILAKVKAAEEAFYRETGLVPFGDEPLVGDPRDYGYTAPLPAKPAGGDAASGDASGGSSGPPPAGPAGVAGPTGEGAAESAKSEAAAAGRGAVTEVV